MKTLKTVVVIDDDSDDLFLTAHELLSYRPTLEIYSFTDMKDGLGFLSTAHDRVDLMFIDLYLKHGVKGTNYIERIHQIAPIIPVVILTMSDDPKDILEAYKYKIANYMIKPVTPEKLQQLERLL